MAKVVVMAPPLTLKSSGDGDNNNNPLAVADGGADGGGGMHLEVDGAADPPPPAHRKRRLRVPLFARKKINWPKLRGRCKQWIRQPMNVALLVWLVFVAACLVVLFLLMTGLLNDAIPKEPIRKRWTEITNQILNALFTIMCIYQHPRLFHHLILLFSTKHDDIVELRKVYCKGGTRRPWERAHILFVLFLLHVTCISQYGLCALYWGFSEKMRPDWAEISCMAVGIVAPILAGLYTVYSPLGRKIVAPPEDDDEEAQRSYSDDEKPENRVAVEKPEWAGGVFDVFDEPAVCAVSFWCPVCVHGWNLERLGFGNMYVHIVTFILFLVAPFWVFSVAAINISDDTVRFTMVGFGAVLCFMGLMYGGFWRTQMRKRFGLPANRLCCGWPSMTDLLQWLFCWWCSLAQEVRTANFYDADEESFYYKAGRVVGSGGGSDDDRDGAELPTSTMEQPREAEMVLTEKQLSVGSTKAVEQQERMAPPSQPVFMVKDDPRGTASSL